MLLCPRGFAAEIAVVGLHAPDHSPQEVAELTQDILRIIQENGSLVAVGPEKLRGRLVGRQELILKEMAQADGVKRLQAGQLLYDRADMTQAIVELEEAVGLLASSVAITGEVRPLRDAYLFLGLSHTGLGNGEEAKRAFAKAVVLDPEMELDPLRYPPRVQEAFVLIRNRIRSAMNASIEVEVPDGMQADIWIDGRNRGPAPVRVEGLSPGRHYIRAVGEGAHRGYKTVGLSSTEELSVFLRLDQHGMGPVAATQRERSQQTASLYRALGAHTGTELVLLGGKHPDTGDLVVQLYSPRSDRFSKPIDLTQPSGSGGRAGEWTGLMASLINQANSQGEIRAESVDARAQAFEINANPVLTGLLLQDSRPVQREPALPQEGNDGASSWLRSYRWWLIGGGAVAAGGVTAAVVVRRVGDNGTITVGPIP
jgi:hypothetical protein